jgi:hypothetical protein
MAAPGRTQVTRLVNGITNVADNNILADFGMLDPSKWIVHFDDFVNFNAADWTETKVGTGSTAIGNVAGGVIASTTTTTSGDSNYLQKTTRGFSLSSGKRAFFKARVSLDNILTSSMIVGLQVSTTLPKVATDGIYFFKNSANSVDFFCRKDTTTGSTSATAVATMVNSTFMELAWFYDGDSTCYYAVDGVVKGSVSATAAFLPDTVLSVSFGFETNAAAARTGTVDYVFAAVER